MVTLVVPPVTWQSSRVAVSPATFTLSTSTLLFDSFKADEPWMSSHTSPVAAPMVPKSQDSPVTWSLTTKVEPSGLTGRSRFHVTVTSPPSSSQRSSQSRMLRATVRRSASRAVVSTT